MVDAACVKNLPSFCVSWMQVVDTREVRRKTCLSPKSLWIGRPEEQEEICTKTAGHKRGWVSHKIAFSQPGHGSLCDRGLGYGKRGRSGMSMRLCPVYVFFFGQGGLRTI